jgi:hypothetical protein
MMDDVRVGDTVKIVRQLTYSGKEVGKEAKVIFKYDNGEYRLKLPMFNGYCNATRRDFDVLK